MNSIGNKLRLTTFGESHGKAMGGIVDGFPPNFKIDFQKVNEELEKRRPGASIFVSRRSEDDVPEFLSGIASDGMTLGTPIGFIIRNNDCRPSDYDTENRPFRPNHADFTYIKKYGIHDFSGGGRASARETVNWVVAGALCLQWLDTKGIQINSILSSVGDVGINDIETRLSNSSSLHPSINISEKEQKDMENAIMQAKKEGDSIGGKVTCIVTGMKPGIGYPVFDKLNSILARYLMSINGAKGIEFGRGFDSSRLRGSEMADCFIHDENGENIITGSNNSGGIQGGISNGMPIFFSVAFKPTPTINKPLSTINMKGEAIVLQSHGRHDPCIAVRAVPVVKAMTALALMDLML